MKKIRTLRSLAPYPIDLYQVQQPWSLSSERKEMRALAELWQSKLIRNIGWRKFSLLVKPAGLSKSLPVVNLVKELAHKYDATPSP